MLLLYLYARTLARRAFGAAPTYEARALFMFLLLSDGMSARNEGCHYPIHMDDTLYTATLVQPLNYHTAFCVCMVAC